MARLKPRTPRSGRGSSGDWGKKLTALLLTLLLGAAAFLVDRWRNPRTPPREQVERAPERREGRPRRERRRVPDPRQQPLAQAKAALNLGLGNPSGAVSDPARDDNYLLSRPQFAAAYSRRRGGPVWASWHLVGSDVGGVDRGEFAPDPLLPAGWYRVRPNDYSGSGYDRGHLVPSADRDATVEDNDAVFTMANIVPQTGDANRGPWEKLERYCRELARDGDELFITAGVYGDQGTLGRGRVAVPSHVWKVAVVLPRGEGDPVRRVTKATRVIAVDVPNLRGIKDDPWRRYRTTVDAIESATGYDLLAGVPRDVQAVVESRVDVK